MGVGETAHGATWFELKMDHIGPGGQPKLVVAVG